MMASCPDNSCSIIRIALSSSIPDDLCGGDKRPAAWATCIARLPLVVSVHRQDPPTKIHMDGNLEAATPRNGIGASTRGDDAENHEVAQSQLRFGTEVTKRVLLDPGGSDVGQITEGVSAAPRLVLVVVTVVRSLARLAGYSHARKII